MMRPRTTRLQGHWAPRPSPRSNQCPNPFGSGSPAFAATARAVCPMALARMGYPSAGRPGQDRRGDGQRRGREGADSAGGGPGWPGELCGAGAWAGVGVVSADVSTRLPLLEPVDAHLPRAGFVGKTHNVVGTLVDECQQATVRGKRFDFAENVYPRTRCFDFVYRAAAPASWGLLFASVEGFHSGGGMKGMLGADRRRGPACPELGLLGFVRVDRAATLRSGGPGFKWRRPSPWRCRRLRARVRQPAAKAPQTAISALEKSRPSPVQFPEKRYCRVRSRPPTHPGGPS